MGTLGLILVIAAGIFAVVALFEARGRNWPAWGVLLLAVALLLGRLG